jgi:Flp pilus assembly pilin Flp
MTKRRLFKRKGQSTAEYAILIGIVVAVAIAMQTYVKRGIQGRLHDASDKFYDNFTGDKNWTNVSSTTAEKLSKKQYEPTQLSSKSTQQILQDDETSTMETGGKVTRESTRRTKQEAGDYQKQDFK